MFLYLKMIEHMIEGRPFLFQPTTKTVVHVSKEGVTVIESGPSLNETIMAFIDADEKDHTPKNILFHDSVQLIVASSPRGTDESWIKQATPRLSITKLVIDLWSYEELFLTGSVLGLLAFVT